MKGTSHKISELKSLDTWSIDPMADYGGSDRKDGLISPDGENIFIKQF